eukprot:c19084_g1_i2 orf=578-1273(-)
MGASLCCEDQEDSDVASQSNGCCCQRCCACHCCRFCCRCCCCWCLPFFHSSGVHDATLSAHITSPSQFAGLLGATSAGVSSPDTYILPPRPFPHEIDTRHIVPLVGCLRLEKNGGNSFHAGDAVLDHRSGGEGLLSIQQCKGVEYIGGKSDVDNSREKLHQPKIVGKDEFITSIMDDDDVCPTCFEGYDNENPKTITMCGHHFHLGCILEWMERSDTCPVCDKEMVFKENH